MLEFRSPPPPVFLNFPRKFSRRSAGSSLSTLPLSPPPRFARFAGVGVNVGVDFICAVPDTDDDDDDARSLSTCCAAVARASPKFSRSLSDLASGSLARPPELMSCSVCKASSMTMSTDAVSLK